jgi:hypothetical protein
VPSSSALHAETLLAVRLQVPPGAPLQAPVAASDATSLEASGMENPEELPLLESLPLLLPLPDELPVLEPLALLEAPLDPLLVDPLADPLPLPDALVPPLLPLDESATASDAPASEGAPLMTPPQAKVHASPSPSQSDRPRVIGLRE